MRVRAARNLYLVGFMGSGKTTVGRILAKRLGRAFRDLDEDIVKSAGCSVSEIFARRGESHFRTLEKQALIAAARRGGLVVATGGGVMCDTGNVEQMRQTGFIICLCASAEEIASRLEGDTTRPKLMGGDRRQAIGELLAGREPFYRQADLAVESGGRTPLQVVEEIVERIGRDGDIRA